MGEVLLATYRGDDGLGISEGRVVLKRTLPRHPNRQYQNKMLLEEGRIGLRLLHQNLVETFAVDQESDDPLLLMEFLGGKSMAQVLGAAKKQRTPLSVELALKIARDIACGLHFAHTLAENGRGLGLVHRDVSPANIFATYDGRVKVIDFGVAKAKDSEIKTSTGILKGKIGYMSPEHAGGQKLTPATDLWSVGVVLWEMLIADRLFSGTTPAVTLYQITHGEIEAPSKRRPDLPGAVSALVMRLLERDLDKRIRSGAELVAAIDRLGLNLEGADVGAHLRSVFPADAENAAADVQRAARRQGPPAPQGLVDGGKDTAETLVRDSGDLLRLAREISVSAGATQVDGDSLDLDLPSGPPSDIDDAPTRAMGIDFMVDPNALRSDEGEAATLVDDGRIRSLLEQGEFNVPNTGADTLGTEEGAPTAADEVLFGREAGEVGPHPPSSVAPDAATAVLEKGQLNIPPPTSPTTPEAPISKRLSGERRTTDPVVDKNALGDAAPTEDEGAPVHTETARNVPQAPGGTPVAPRSPSSGQPAPAAAALDGPTPGPREAMPVAPRSASTVSVALASFGAIALVLGMVFSFVAHRRAAGRTPVVYVYPGDLGTDVIVARVSDAPADKREELGAIDLAAPIARIQKDGPRQKRDPVMFRKHLVENKILERARLPTGGRKTAAALPPAIVLLSLIALALALPSFLGMSAVVSWLLRLILLGACGVVGFLGVTGGVLSWPGTAAYQESGEPPRLDAASMATAAAESKDEQKEAQAED